MVESVPESSLQRVVKPRPIADQDMLASIFAGQRELMAKYHDIEALNGSKTLPTELEGDLDSRQVQNRLHEVYGYITRELSEAMQELKNKPWKQTTEVTVRQNFVEEVGDTLHFFVEFCIVAGISAEELHDNYFRMNRKNTERQQNGY